MRFKLACSRLVKFEIFEYFFKLFKTMHRATTLATATRHADDTGLRSKHRIAPGSGTKGGKGKGKKGGRGKSGFSNLNFQFNFLGM